MDLPKELRLMVYELATDVRLYRPATCYQRKYTGLRGGIVLPWNQPPIVEGGCAAFEVYRDYSSSRYPHLRWPTEQPPLLTVSRQVRHEALSFFYAGNDFHFSECSVDKVLEWLVRVRKASMLRYVRCVALPGFEESDGDDVIAGIALLLQQYGFAYELSRADIPRYERLETAVIEGTKAISVEQCEDATVGKNVEELLDVVRAWVREMFIEEVTEEVIDGT